MKSPILKIQMDDICIARALKACNCSMPELNPFLIRQPNSSRSHASRYKRVLAREGFASDDLRSFLDVNTSMSRRRMSSSSWFPPYIDPPTQSESLTSCHPIAVIGCARKGVSILISIHSRIFCIYFLVCWVLIGSSRLITHERLRRCALRARVGSRRTIQSTPNTPGNKYRKYGSG